VRVVSFNTSEGRARDISADVAEELRRRCDLQMREVPAKYPRVRSAIWSCLAASAYVAAARASADRPRHRSRRDL